MNSELKRKLIYIMLVVGLVWMYISYVPFLLDYYVCRPELSFLEFYQQNVLSPIFEFEGILLAIVLAFLFCLIWDSAWSMGIASLLLFLLTHGSYVKYLNRKELLRLADFQLTEAAGMAAGYLEVELDRYLAALVIGLVLFVVAAIGIEMLRRKVLFPKPEEADDDNNDTKDADERKEALKGRIVICVARSVAALVIFCVGVFYTNQFVLAHINMENSDGISPVERENDRYILYRFVKNESLDVIDVEHVEESYEFLLSQEEAREVEETAVKPNVIVIMNESWWNTDNIVTDNITFSKDPMEPYKRLADECVTGYLTSNVYGGGTISSEAEFLTGINTKYYVTSSTIYEETLDKKLPSLVDYFNELNYETVAIHPYYGDFYSRDQVYETMGFDEAIFDEDMKNREIYSRYISDESLVKEIIDEYEERDGENKFIWSVSVGNHRRTLAYYLDNVEDYEYPISVDLNGAELEEEEIDTLVNYVNGIYLAGEAYEQLIEYFSNKKEPVIVVMYGDHIPGFSVDTLSLMGIEEDSESIDMFKRMYSVPVVMWSNFDLVSEPDFDGENIYYLPQMLIESAGLPDSEMSRMLKHQRSIFKTNSRAFVLDGRGNPVWECTEEQVETLNHGKAVTYDILFGEESRQNIWHPIITEE